MIAHGASLEPQAPRMSGPSSIVFPRLAEESNDPVLSEGEVLPVRWTAEIIAALDWRKLVEIARAVTTSAGYEPGATTISLDGSAEFLVSRGQGIDSWTECVRLAPWNRWMASSGCMQQFVAALASMRKTRGVYLAPGGVSPSAAIEAARHGIDLVDAEALAATLNELPSEHSEYFHDATLTGQPFVPTCPVCLRPLSRVDDGPPEPLDLTSLPDISYTSNDIVAGTVMARRIEVLQGCEVHFLREVRAHDLVVHGMVIGDFICESGLLLNPGSVLSGTVAARSVLVRPGAELRGETRILKDGELSSMEKASTGWTWRCGNLPAMEGCGEVEFLPH